MLRSSINSLFLNLEIPFFFYKLTSLKLDFILQIMVSQVKYNSVSIFSNLNGLFKVLS